MILVSWHCRVRRRAVRGGAAVLLKNELQRELKNARVGRDGEFAKAASAPIVMTDGVKEVERHSPKRYHLGCNLHVRCPTGAR